MRFNFEDGQVRDVRAGGNVCGMMLGGKHPASVTLTSKELTLLLKDKEYAVYNVLKCLAREGE